MVLRVMAVMWNSVFCILGWLKANGCVSEFHAKNLRSDFFNGFLSLAGFVLAARTFLIVYMKQEVYDKEDYEIRFYKRRQLVGERNATRYGPLIRMSKALYWIVLSSAVAAVSQITLGLIPCNLFALICMVLATVAIGSFLCGIHIMKKNIDSWLDIINSEEEAKPPR
jgi:hypothetical protein